MKKLMKRMEFENIAKLTMPELFDKSTPVINEVSGDAVMYVYTLAEPLLLEHVIDIFEEERSLVLIYHYIPSYAVIGGHSCCAMTNPASEMMIRVYASTDVQGMVDKLFVTYYYSLEIMQGELVSELQMMEKLGSFEYKLPLKELIWYFL